jgi:hypothetical protein
VRDSNANGNSDSKPDSYSYTEPDGYGYGDTYRHCNANSHSYRNADGDDLADSYSNTDTVRRTRLRHFKREGYPSQQHAVSHQPRERRSLQLCAGNFARVHRLQVAGTYGPAE